MRFMPSIFRRMHVNKPLDWRDSTNARGRACRNAFRSARLVNGSIVMRPDRADVTRLNPHMVTELVGRAPHIHPRASGRRIRLRYPVQLHQNLFFWSGKLASGVMDSIGCTELQQLLLQLGGVLRGAAQVGSKVLSRLNTTSLACACGSEQPAPIVRFQSR